MLVLAHGVGSRGDLPLPLWQFSWAAIAALAISFVALGALWTTPRLGTLAVGRPLSWTKALLRVAEPTARAVSFGLFLLVVIAGLFGTDSTTANINPVTIYVVFWVVLQLAVAGVGDVWRVLSPFDTMAIALDLIRPRHVGEQAMTAWLDRNQTWFAPIGAFAFLALELVHPSGDSPRVLGVAMVVYSVIVMAAVARWGREWLSRGETFTVLFGLLAAMAPVHRDDEGQLRLRAPLAGLGSLEVSAATTALILVVLGGTSFDGFGDSELWRDIVGSHRGWTEAGWRLFGLVDVIAIVAALYLAGVRAMANATGRSARSLASVFAPSLVPILFGYTIAHYLQLAIDETQSFVFRLSDPLGRGWDLFGGADGTINFDIVSVDAVAWCQALAIVGGHIAGVVVAHDRAVATFERRDALRSQYVMLAVMVLYSILGLWLLLNA